MPGVYISYPFCTQKCTFCNFASGIGTAENKTDYEAALLDEVRSHRWDWQPETLYFGGGTPSLMPLSLLQRIVESIPSACLTEATVECAPGTLTEDNVREWVRFGINRVSLGVQSFVTTELRQTGRRHEALTVQRDVELLRACGIENFNIDLIAGLPGQTRTSWAESLDWLTRLNPPHVSVYLFEMDEDSRLGKEALLGGTRYGAALLPSDDLAAEFYESAVSHLSRMGIHRYEISNFAVPGKESLHNLKYWTLAPYVGFGVDAASFDGKLRRHNPDTLEEYLQRATPIPELSNPAEERFFVGLRLSGGVEPTSEEWEMFSEPISKWLREGMLERSGHKLRLSNRGVLVSNEILADFI